MGGATCASIEGFDVSVFYFYAIGQEMPICTFAILEWENDQSSLRVDVSHCAKFLDRFHWMDDVAQSAGICIKHKLDEDCEHRVDPFQADGFCPKTHTFISSGAAIFTSTTRPEECHPSHPGLWMHRR